MLIECAKRAFIFTRIKHTGKLEFFLNLHYCNLDVELHFTLLRLIIIGISFAIITGIQLFQKRWFELQELC